MGLTQKLRDLSSRLTAKDRKSSSTSAVISAAPSAAPTPATTSRVPTPCPETQNPEAQNYPEFLASESPPPSPAPPALSSENVPSEVPQRLWRRAYEELKDPDFKGSEPEVVKAYETILAKICRNDTENMDNNAQPAPPTRQEMWDLVQEGLERTKKGAKAKGKVDEALRIVDTVKKPIDASMRFIPEAAPLWAGVTIGLEILQNPMKQPGLNRKGMEYILSRMEWYWSLSTLVLDQNKLDRPSGALLSELEDRLVDLYKKLVLYQMRSTCLYHRNWATVTLRDTVTLDDWTGAITEIKEAESSLRSDYNQYTLIEASSQRDQIEQNTRALKPGLDKIDLSIRAQTESRRQEQHNERDQQCLRDLLVTDPEEDRKRILTKKGKLLRESYSWILTHKGFVDFRENPETQLLWVRGDPGKGKSMLLCGIIEELGAVGVPMSYFFCEATEAAQSNVTAVLRGLIYMLARRNSPLISHVRNEYDIKGTKAFNGINASVSLEKILTAMIEDERSRGTILIVDALDECTSGEEHIAEMIVRLSNLKSGYVKWVVSSRNWPDIEQHLLSAENPSTVHLEMNRASVSSAVNTYIDVRVKQLPRTFSQGLRDKIRQYLLENADNTFLWVSLVCKRIASLKPHMAEEDVNLKKFPPGLDALYKRMMSQILESEEAERLAEVLRTVFIAFRPLRRSELSHLAKTVQEYDDDTIGQIVLTCGSFLTLQGDSIYFVHQSAKDFLQDFGELFADPTSFEDEHWRVCVMSLRALKTKLKRNIYNLDSSDYSIGKELPMPRPLYEVANACEYWLHHIIASDLKKTTPMTGLSHVFDFFKHTVLFWMEAALTLRYFKRAAKHMGRLVGVLFCCDIPDLRDFVWDAFQFMTSHGRMITFSPARIYDTALIFSPQSSLIRQNSRQEEPDWISCKPEVQSYSRWELRRTLHSRNTVTCSTDGRILAATSPNRHSPAVLEVLEGSCHVEIGAKTLSFGEPVSISFSPDGSALAVAESSIVSIWEWSTDKRDHIFKLPGNYIRLITCFLSNDRLISASLTKSNVQIWALDTSNYHGTDSQNGVALISERPLDDEKLKADALSVMAYSQDGKMIAISGPDMKVRIWTRALDVCLVTLPHEDPVTSITFARDDTSAITGTNAGKIMVWDNVPTGPVSCVHAFHAGDKPILSLAVSIAHRELLLATGGGISSWDCPVLFQKKGFGCSTDRRAAAQYGFTSRAKSLAGHGSRILRLGFSPNGNMLVSKAEGGQVKIWSLEDGRCVLTCDNAIGVRPFELEQVDAWFAFSADSLQLALVLRDSTIGVWRLTTLERIHTLRPEPPRYRFRRLWAPTLAFSPDGKNLTMVSDDITVWSLSEEVCIQTTSMELLGAETIDQAIFSPDRSLVGLCKWLDRGRTELQVWDLVSRRCIQTYPSRSWIHEMPLSFSDDNKWMVTENGKNFRLYRIVRDEDNSHGSASPATACLSQVKEGVQSVYTPFGDVSMEAKDSEGNMELFGFGISLCGQWIMKGGKKMMWIPDEYRPAAIDVPRQTIAFPCRDRRITFMKLSNEGKG